MTDCPNCVSSAALGTDAASVCSECASVSVLGASMNAPTLLALAAGTVAVALEWRAAKRALGSTFSIATAKT